MSPLHSGVKNLTYVTFTRQDLLIIRHGSLTFVDHPLPARGWRCRRTGVYSTEHDTHAISERDSCNVSATLSPHAKTPSTQSTAIATSKLRVSTRAGSWVKDSHNAELVVYRVAQKVSHYH